MIKRLYVDNYKCLVNFDISLQDLCLLFGSNGVGKSSLLEVVFAIRQLLRGVARLTDQDIFPTRSLTRWQRHSFQVVEMDLEISNYSFTYRIEISHDLNNRRARVIKEILSCEGVNIFSFLNGDVHLFRDDGSAGPVYTADWNESALARVSPRHDNKKLTSFLDFVRKIIICQINPRGLVPETGSEDYLLERDGSNFVAWFRHIFQERPDLHNPFTELLGEVMEGFVGIRLEKVGQETRAFKLVFQHDSERIEFGLDELSDGQRVLIVIYALASITTGQGYTLFLDEPDNFVALPEIQPWLLTLSDVCGRDIPQAVLCSHHPEIIDYLGNNNSGLLLKKELSGAIKVKRAGELHIEPPMRLSEAIARGWESE